MSEKMFVLEIGPTFDTRAEEDAVLREALVSDRRARRVLGIALGRSPTEDTIERMAQWAAERCVEADHARKLAEGCYARVNQPDKITDDELNWVNADIEANRLQGCQVQGAVNRLRLATLRMRRHLDTLETQHKAEVAALHETISVHQGAGGEMGQLINDAGAVLDDLGVPRGNNPLRCDLVERIRSLARMGNIQPRQAAT